MNILFISKDLGQINLACKLAEEGHAVKLFEIEVKGKSKIRRPLIKFVANWENELDWVGKGGLIVFDYTGMGKTQDELREKGYSVFGGCELGDKLENNRQYGQKIFSLLGMKTKQSIDFYGIEKIIEFLKKNKKCWVIKQNGHMDKGLNYVCKTSDSRDAISVLKSYKKNLKDGKLHFDLQEKVEGIELAVGRFFNGNDWAGPLCLNIEHKNLFNNDLGPKTHEMGNLMWYEENENNKLYQETLEKMEDYLRKIKFKGYFDINCIVNKEGAYPLEATARLGQPTAQIQNTIQLSSWGEFMKAIADGKKYDLKYRKGYATVAFVGTPPYPYANRSNLNSPKGLEIFFNGDLSEDEKNNIYLEEVSTVKKNEKTEYVISGNSGYIAHVAGFGKTVGEAREKMYNLIEKIVIPKMFYRTDIGLEFINRNEKKLKEWRWI
jgi:phosphoribosylamine--glycine ligase